jgi:hypothetical protein
VSCRRVPQPQPTVAACGQCMLFHGRQVVAAGDDRLAACGRPHDPPVTVPVVPTRGTTGQRRRSGNGELIIYNARPGWPS